MFLITDDDDPCARMDKTKNLAQVTKSTKVKMKVRPVILFFVDLSSPRS